MNYTALKNSTFTLKSLTLSTFLVFSFSGSISAASIDELNQEIAAIEQRLEGGAKQQKRLTKRLYRLYAELETAMAEQDSIVTEEVTIIEDEIIIDEVIVTEGNNVIEDVIIEEAIVEEEVIVEENMTTETQQCNQQSSSEYTLTWDFDDSLDLTGYKVYYGTSSNLSKENAMGEFSQEGNANSTTFVPANLNLTTCETIYVAIAALGDKPESALSDVMEILID